MKKIDKHGHYAKEKRSILRLYKKEDDVFLQKGTQNVKYIILIRSKHSISSLDTKFFLSIISHL